MGYQGIFPFWCNSHIRHFGFVGYERDKVFRTSCNIKASLTSSLDLGGVPFMGILSPKAKTCLKS